MINLGQEFILIKKGDGFKMAFQFFISGLIFTIIGTSDVIKEEDTT